MKHKNLTSVEVAEIVAPLMNWRSEDISNVEMLKRGMTNRSYLFSHGDKRYIVRIPGEGTGKMIDRYKEYNVYKSIAPLNICDDVVYIDPQNGYKITVFWEDARVCDPNNPQDVAACMNRLKTFHNFNIEVPHVFDVFERINFYEGLWSAPSLYADYANTKSCIMELQEYISSLQLKLTLTHIDANPDNFLFITNAKGEQEIRLIDWEYTAMQDIHLDIAMFAVYSMYNHSQIENLIRAYFAEYIPSLSIKSKIYAYIAMCGLLWSNWCEYKSQLGVEFGEYSLKQYQFAKDYYQIFKETQIAHG